MPNDVARMVDISPVAVVRNMDPEGVRREVLELRESMSAHSNFILSAGCDIPADAPFLNIEAFRAAAREQGTVFGRPARRGHREHQSDGVSAAAAIASPPHAGHRDLSVLPSARGSGTDRPLRRPRRAPLGDNAGGRRRAASGALQCTWAPQLSSRGPPVLAARRDLSVRHSELACLHEGYTAT